MKPNISQLKTHKKLGYFQWFLGFKEARHFRNIFSIARKCLLYRSTRQFFRFVFGIFWTFFCPLDSPKGVKATTCRALSLNRDPACVPRVQGEVARQGSQERFQVRPGERSGCYVNREGLPWAQGKPSRSFGASYA